MLIDKMETKAMFVLLLLVNMVIGDSHTGCPSSSLYSDLVQVSDQVSKMAANYSKDIASLSFTVSSLAAHVLNTSSSSNCENILNYSTCASLRRDVTKQGKAILSAVTKLDNKLDNVATIALSNQESIENLTININQLLLQGYRPSPLLHSCEEIKTYWPHSPSGYYIIADNLGHTRHVYCQMENICGSGGWMRVAYLNMSDSTEECPPGFKLYQSGGVRACGRQSSNSAGCQSVKFPSYGKYSQVCGRLLGYQYGSPDAISSSGIYGTGHNDINSYYVDGISLTCGSPRQHIWTFMAGNSEKVTSHYNCPCNQGSTQTVQSFIGSDYFCESGNQDTIWKYKLYTTDPVWDKKNCSIIERSCCQVTGLPWFHKIIQSPKTDGIELRVCGDEGTSNEDVPVNYYEIYVK